MIQPRWPAAEADFPPNLANGVAQSLSFEMRLKGDPSVRDMCRCDPRTAIVAADPGKADQVAGKVQNTIGGHQGHSALQVDLAEWT
jgi:hypothetical protein